jgi:hypothetical protein
MSKNLCIMSKNLLLWLLLHWWTELKHYSIVLPIDEDTAGPEIPVAQQKRMMLNMFPEPWVRNFANSGQNPTTVTIVTLLSYMNEQHSAEIMYSERKRDFNHYSGQNDNTRCMRGNGNGHQNHFDDYHDGHNDNTNGNNNDNTNGNNNDYHHHHDHSADNREHNFNYYNGNYYQRGANSGQGNDNGRTHNDHENGNQRGSFTPMQQDDECRIHGGHLWRHCYLNPCRDNTTPVYGNRGRRGRRSVESDRPAGQNYSIVNGSDHSSCAELQRTSFYGGSSGMDDGLVGTEHPQPHSIGRPFQR